MNVRGRQGLTRGQCLYLFTVCWLFATLPTVLAQPLFAARSKRCYHSTKCCVSDYPLLMCCCNINYIYHKKKSILPPLQRRLVTLGITDRTAHFVVTYDCQVFGCYIFAVASFCSIHNFSTHFYSFDMCNRMAINNQKNGCLLLSFFPLVCKKRLLACGYFPQNSYK